MKSAMFSGMSKFAERIECAKLVYERVLEHAEVSRNGCNVVRVTEKQLFNDVLENFGNSAPQRERSARFKYYL